MSNPAVIFGSLLLPSMVGRSSFLGVRARIVHLQTIRYCAEGRPSHLIFRECPKGGVRRIPLLRTRVNRGWCVETVSKFALEDLTLAPPTRGSGHGAQPSQRRCPSTLFGSLLSPGFPSLSALPLALRLP